MPLFCSSSTYPYSRTRRDAPCEPLPVDDNDWAAALVMQSITSSIVIKRLRIADISVNFYTANCRTKVQKKMHICKLSRRKMSVLVRFVDFWPKMTDEMQISLGLTCFQFALALLLPSSHTRLGLCGSGRRGAGVVEKRCKDKAKFPDMQIIARANLSRMRFWA